MSDEIVFAKQNKIPIVGLESTIITHGMPFPDNFKTAIEAENLIRNTGAIPATIAVINGQIKVGLSKEEINELSRSKTVEKLSTNNFSMAIAKKQTGSTTVAATLLVTKAANISVFATGGIGGAHRDSNNNFDISADLRQLAVTPVNVVCAGPKAILDIPKTIELLESFGVPVITYQNNTIPAFWSRDSGLNSPIVAETVEEIVQSYRIRTHMGSQTAQLICNPIPVKNEIKKHIIAPLINQSIKFAEKNDIKGKDLTPFLLSQILKETEGKSLKANKALLFNNIDLATKIANTLPKSFN